MEERKIKKKKGSNRKLQPRSDYASFPKFVSPRTFKKGDLLVNKDGIPIVQQNEDEAAPPVKPSDKNHLSLADLHMIKVIGKGSSGIVLLIRHKRTGQFFALKAIQVNLRETRVKQIAQEVKINQSVQYTNVATCYQAFYKNGVISIIFEYMDGGSLSDFLKKVVAIPEPYLAAICKQVLKGFSYLHHDKHIIHRDMKTSNLLINHRGEVKITGFGASATLATASAERNNFVGTYNYMSPERISGESYGYKSDIWSLGLVILECATGQFPYSTSEQEEGWHTCYELMEAIVDGELPHAPPEQFSPEFCSFISACLQKDPKDRLAANVLMEHSFIKKYEDKDVNLASYFANAGSQLPTFEKPICGKFKEGDLLVNKDVVRTVQQIGDKAAPPIQPTDNHQLSLADIDIIKVIGKGSSGIVQLIQHKRTGQFFALKAIQVNFQKTLVKQIAREVYINQSAKCTNVAICYQAFYENDVISIFLEYMDGGSLSDFLKKVVAIPESYLAAICKQVLKGLWYLHHDKHIIHRNMKPSNLLINHRGEVKITDFGVSAILATTSAERNTFVGTYNYMSPERITGEAYGYKSDIWSFGLVILECATGQFPYSPSEQEEGWDNCYELMEAIVDSELPHAPPEQFSPEFCSFISACLQKDPKDRLAANELMEHSFIKKYEDKDVNLASYFADAESQLATFEKPIWGIQDIAAPETEKFLHIKNLENVKDGREDAELAKLKDKQHLEDLYLSWNSSSSSSSSSDDDECIGRSANDGKVLEGLQPRPNLKILTISGFRGLKLPKWMGSSSNFLPNLVELYISYCTRCEKLPALGMLPCLRVLWIYGMRSMKCLGQEFYYQDEEEITPSFAKATTVTLFPSLIELSIENMKTLEEWVSPPQPYICFPTLETLWIIGCSELASVPDFQLCTSLRELTIRDCYKLNKESTSFDLIQKEEHDSSKATQSPNLITIDSGILDIEALRTEKFLHIRNLENVRGGIEDAESAKLKDKQHLEDLYLSWNSSSDDDNDECTDRSVRDGMVLEGLQPHSNLRKLSISGFEGLKLPKWMMGSLSNSLPNLVELYLLECNSCEQLPALGMLRYLKILEIKGMNSVKYLPEDFYYQQQEEISADITSVVSFFPSLIELSLIDMSILEEWAAPPLFFDSFSSLESLIISSCLRLKSISLTSCFSLKSLELCNTNDETVNSILASGVERLTSLVSVSIQDSSQFEFFPVLLQKDACIQSLKIEYCSKFQGFRILDADNDNKEFQAKLSSDTGFNTSISSLCSLKLTDCPALTSLPDLRKWTSLTELWIEDCDKVKRSFSYDLKSLDNLKTLYIDRFIDLSQE